MTCRERLAPGVSLFCRNIWVKNICGYLCNSCNPKPQTNANPSFLPRLGSRRFSPHGHPATAGGRAQLSAHVTPAQRFHQHENLCHYAAGPALCRARRACYALLTYNPYSESILNARPKKVPTDSLGPFFWVGFWQTFTVRVVIFAFNYLALQVDITHLASD